MTQTVNEDDRCRVCGQTFGWHEENQPRHPFTPEGASLDFLKRPKDRDRSGRKTSQSPAEPPVIASMAHDPVVRIALINRGILTPADLMVAEAQLRDALAVAQEGGNPWLARGEESSDSSTPTGNEPTKPSSERESPSA
jgi:hypothetical protein